VEIMPPRDHLFLDLICEAFDLGVIIFSPDTLTTWLVFGGWGPGVHVNTAGVFHDCPQCLRAKQLSARLFIRRN
jgi:hypothetical protein